MQETKLRRAWGETVKAQTTVSYFWLGNLLPAAAGYCIGTLLIPAGSSAAMIPLYQVGGTLAGVILCTTLIFIRNLFRAPYLQRTEIMQSAFQQLRNEGYSLLSESGLLDGQNSGTFAGRVSAWEAKAQAVLESHGYSGVKIMTDPNTLYPHPGSFQNIQHAANSLIESRTTLDEALKDNLAVLDAIIGNKL